MLTQPSIKYHPAQIIDFPARTWPSKQLKAPPRWCSTDLRDGNQALANPMDHTKKMAFFKHLIECGFKEIEVAFPAASQTDFDFVRLLIEGDHIPDDVTIQVMTQSRVDLIERTIQSLVGAKKAIVHIYNATAPVFREVVFCQDKTATLELAVQGIKHIRQLCEQNPDTQWTLQYSPETFCFTEADFALEVCEAAAKTWQPSLERPMILNLPTTVEVNTPNVFADQIEHFITSFSSLENITISVHPHNDRGTGVATAEMAILAGAQRVEGCLFGNGERTGNVDLVTLAMNLYSQGVHPNLDFSDIRRTVELVEECNELPVHPRHPYAGSLAFTAFSGSHQDAIKKGFAAQKLTSSTVWQIPYLPLDPKDIGCSYEEVIRVNSQSGKSGAAWLLQENHGLFLPRKLQIDFSKKVKNHTDQTGHEMPLADVWRLFRESYRLNPDDKGQMKLMDYRSHSSNGLQEIRATLRYQEKTWQLVGEGKGLLSAMLDALRKRFNWQINISDFHEHTLGQQTKSKAVSYVQIESDQVPPSFGVAIDEDSTKASLQALINACHPLYKEA
ncbi:MAG: 2-isopropylmalate synthase [Gammaproteobacteria bacterium]|nr:2-isopropylmalate synthase [Gammaproteobacteria bacterium]